MTVATPSGQKSASAVATIETTRQFGIVYDALSGLTNGGTGSSKTLANAVALEVSPGRWLFALPVQENGSSVYPLGLHGFMTPQRASR